MNPTKKFNIKNIMRAIVVQAWQVLRNLRTGVGRIVNYTFAILSALSRNAIAFYNKSSRRFKIAIRFVGGFLGGLAIIVGILSFFRIDAYTFLQQPNFGLMPTQIRPTPYRFSIPVSGPILPVQTPIISADDMVFVPAGYFLYGSTDDQIEQIGEACSKPYPIGFPGCNKDLFADELPKKKSTWTTSG